jgi:hypothetical protein
MSSERDEPGRPSCRARNNHSGLALSKIHDVPPAAPNGGYSRSAVVPRASGLAAQSLAAVPVTLLTFDMPQSLRPRRAHLPEKNLSKPVGNQSHQRPGESARTGRQRVETDQSASRRPQTPKPCPLKRRSHTFRDTQSAKGS